MSKALTVRVLFFASLREALGRELVLEVPSCTVDELRAQLLARGEPFATALGAGRAVRASVDQVMAEPAQVITQDCELAFFPPVTGG